MLNFCCHFFLLQTVHTKGTDCPQHPGRNNQMTSAQNEVDKCHKPKPKQSINSKIFYPNVALLVKVG